MGRRIAKCGSAELLGAEAPKQITI
jgi:hypothetical protein